MKYKTQVLATGCAGLAVSLILFAGSLSGQKPLTEILRPVKGADSTTEHLQIQIGEERKAIDVTVTAVPYGEEEQQVQLREASDQLENIFIGQNDSLDHVTMDVSMPVTLPDSEAEIQWYLDSWEYLEPDGTIKNEGLTESVPVQVQAILTFGEESLTWNRTIQICPPEEPDADMLVRMLKYQLREEAQKDESILSLPSEIDGKPVVWYPQRDTRWMWTILLTGAAICGLWVGHRKDEEQEQQKYERQMQLSYPDIVSRLSLYMGAGISSRRAWERIVQHSSTAGPAYEQMLMTLRQMQSGVSEITAYEQFGMKCRLPSYLKLGTLLSQNLRLGTRDLSGMLKAEAREAFEDRKALARKMGEECESKLLLPMLLMLLSILIMIMYPAVVSFTG